MSDVPSPLAPPPPEPPPRLVPPATQHRSFAPSRQKMPKEQFPPTYGSCLQRVGQPGFQPSTGSLSADVSFCLPLLPPGRRGLISSIACFHFVHSERPPCAPSLRHGLRAGFSPLFPRGQSWSFTSQRICASPGQDAGRRSGGVEAATFPDLLLCEKSRTRLLRFLISPSFRKHLSPNAVYPFELRREDSCRRSLPPPWPLGRRHFIRLLEPTLRDVALQPPHSPIRTSCRVIRCKLGEVATAYSSIL